MPWRLIPQTLYDLIGRILPASVVLLLVFVVVWLPTLQELPSVISRLNELATATSVTVAMIATYTVGVVLGQIYAVTFGKLLATQDSLIEARCRQECFGEHERTLEALGRERRKIDPTRLPRTFVMHDHLRLIAPTEIPRLLKVRAERRMAEVIALGAVISIVVNTVLLAMTYSTYRLVLEALLVLTVVGAWRSSIRRLKNFTNGTTIMWLMHATEGPFEVPRIQHSDRDANLNDPS